MLKTGKANILEEQDVDNVKDGKFEQTECNTYDSAGAVKIDPKLMVYPKNVESEMSLRQDISGMTPLKTVARRDSNGNFLRYFADKDNKILTWNVAIPQNTTVDTPVIDTETRSAHDESGSPITVSQFEMIEDGIERLGTKSSGSPKNLTKELAFNEETVQHLLLDEGAWGIKIRSRTT